MNLKNTSKNKFKKKTIIIAGANDFIGQHLVEKLSRLDFEIYLIDIEFGNLTEYNNSENCKMIAFDSDYKFVSKLPNNVEYSSFINLAWVGAGGALKESFPHQFDNVNIGYNYLNHLSKHKID